jgi:MFS family permease
MRFNALSATAIFFILYAAIYGAFGIASPFWPRFFESRGLSSQELGILLGLGTLMRLISGPLVGRLADALGRLRAALAACLALAAALALALLLADAFWSLLIIHLAQMAALAPVTTTADALATSGARRGIRAGFVYGRIRGTASAAFVAGTLATGLLLGGAAVSIVFMHAALLAAAATAALLLPQFDIPSGRQTISLASFTGGVRELWASVIFRRVIVVSALVYGSHAVHDAFAVIRWNEAGIGPVMTSVLWSEAVAAEVVMFFLIGPALVNRLGTNGGRGACRRSRCGALVCGGHDDLHHRARHGAAVARIYFRTSSPHMHATDRACCSGPVGRDRPSPVRARRGPYERGADHALGPIVCDAGRLSIPANGATLSPRVALGMDWPEAADRFDTAGACQHVLIRLALCNTPSRL